MNKVVLAGALASVMAVVGCGGGADSAAAKDSTESGSIVVQGYSGVFQDNYQKAVIEPFEKQFPDIDVTYRGVTSSADNLASLRAAQREPNVDVSIMDISVADTANKSDLFQPLEPSAVPNMADLDDRAKVDGSFGPGVTFDSLVLIYNQKISPAPASTEDLWDPRFAGRVVVPAHPDIQGTSLMLIENSKAGADYAKTVEPGVKRLKELAPSVQTWAPQPDAYTLVQSGTADVAVGWNARAQFYADQSQGAMKVAIPEDATVFQVNTINLVAGAKSPAAAQTFINYALGVEAQSTFTDTMFYAPTNTKATPSPDALARTSADPEKLEAVLDVDWTTVATKRDDWTQIWRRQILSS